MSYIGRWLVILAATMAVASCAETQLLVHTAKRVSPSPAPAPAGTYKVGEPYQIAGIWYHPQENYDYDETGIASWYGQQFHGLTTANGELFDMNGLTAAHRTLPLPSLVRVTNLENGRSVVLRINDRGPFARGRILDVSRRSAQLLGFEGQGTAKVRVQILAGESRTLAANMKGEPVMVGGDTPITVASLPKEAVSSQALPPVPGSRVAPQAPAPRPEPSVVNAAVQLTSAPPVSLDPIKAVSGDVTVVSVQATAIFVQPGAFRQYDNANRVRAILSGVGDFKIEPVLIGGRDLFRVRMGPLASVDEADKILDAVIGAGYQGARIVID